MVSNEPNVCELRTRGAQHRALSHRQTAVQRTASLSLGRLYQFTYLLTAD